MREEADKTPAAGLDPAASVRLIAREAERNASHIAELASSLSEYAISVKREADRLVEALDEAANELAGLQHEDQAGPINALAVSAGARLLATQLVVGGSGREEIEERLRDEFGIEEASGILDTISGPGLPG